MKFQKIKKCAAKDCALFLFCGSPFLGEKATLFYFSKSWIAYVKIFTIDFRLIARQPMDKKNHSKFAYEDVPLPPDSR